MQQIRIKNVHWRLGTKTVYLVGTWIGLGLLILYGFQKQPFISHRIHGAAIYDNIYHQYTPNVGIYTSIMDPMGILSFWSLKVQKRRGRVASSKVEAVGGKVAQVSGRQNWKFQGFLAADCQLGPFWLARSELFRHTIQYNKNRM